MMDKDLKENVKLLLERVRTGKEKRETIHQCEECRKECSFDALRHRKSRLSLIFGKRVSWSFSSQFLSGTSCFTRTLERHSIFKLHWHGWLLPQSDNSAHQIDWIVKWVSICPTWSGVLTLTNGDSSLVCSTNCFRVTFLWHIRIYQFRGNGTCVVCVQESCCFSFIASNDFDLHVKATTRHLIPTVIKTVFIYLDWHKKSDISVLAICLHLLYSTRYLRRETSTQHCFAMTWIFYLNSRIAKLILSCCESDVPLAKSHQYILQ